MLPPPPRIQTYAEFWPFYLQQHRHRSTRILHAVGTLIGLAIASVGAAKGKPRWALSALLPSYGMAWISHFFIERNRPATFRYPLWSFVSDFRMIALLLQGKI